MILQLQFYSYSTAPFGIDLDVKNRQLYWSDSGTGSVKRVGIDGDNIATIYSGAAGMRKVSLETKAR